MRTSLIFVMVLIYIAARVAVGMCQKRSMWGWIAVYWVVLTLKNAADLWETIV